MSKRSRARKLRKEIYEEIGVDPKDRSYMRLPTGQIFDYGRLAYQRSKKEGWACYPSHWTGRYQEVWVERQKARMEENRLRRQKVKGS